MGDGIDWGTALIIGWLRSPSRATLIGYALLHSPITWDSSDGNFGHYRDRYRFVPRAYAGAAATGIVLFLVFTM